MHKHSFAAFLGLISLLSLGTFATTANLLEEREEVKVALEETIDRASASYKERTSYTALKSFQEKTLRDMGKLLSVMGKEKRKARLELAHARKQISAIKGTQLDVVEDTRRDAAYGVGFADEQMESIIRNAFLREPILLDASPFEEAVGKMIAPEMSREILKAEAYALAHETLTQKTEQKTVELLRVLKSAEEAEQNSQALEIQLNDLRTAYLDALVQSERARDGLLISDSELAAAKAEAAEVHKNVLRLQAHLAEIDRSLRKDSENSLLEMGLLSEALGEAPVQASAQTFIWPVDGYISAHFHDELYKQFFGIPHNAIDIVTAQLTPVKSAADGVVFLVKDGGLTGYSYILIGHRDGIATLYGHMNVAQVAPGQELKAGDVIGLSGGAPGTAGAGPITTGSHLHFEVIKDGVNIDPLSVLPE